jgi:hypothetical protein
MHVFTQDFFVALMIGAEVFAVAALWPLSDWAVRTRSPWPVVCSVLLIAACLAPHARAVLFHGAPDWLAARVLEWAAVALLLLFPDAVCVASGQSLARAGMPARWARGVALALAGMAVLVTPLATIVAGCSLLGACY